MDLNLGNPYLRFSLLLLNSLIMSDRKTRRTSMVSGDWAEFFSRTAITFRISGCNKHILFKGWGKECRQWYRNYTLPENMKIFFWFGEFVFVSQFLRIRMLKRATFEAARPFTSSLAWREAFVEINSKIVRGSQHVQMVMSHDSRLNTPEIEARGKKKKSLGQWSLSYCNCFRIVPNENARVKGLCGGLGFG